MMIILTKIKGSDGHIFLQSSLRTRLRELLILYYVEFVLIIINSQKRADKDFIREFCRVRILFVSKFLSGIWFSIVPKNVRVCRKYVL